MENPSRTAMTKINAKASVINRIITLFCNFLCRTVFIKCLSAQYLGVGGMFGNVFSVISLCELGFGEALSQSMFRPLAEKNHDEIKAIVKYYTSVYRYISLVSTAASLVLLPFLPKIFPDIIKIKNYRIIYILFTVNQLFAYRFAPKRSLIISDQRMYVIMNIRSATTVLVTASQILWLVLTGSYTGYLFLRILFLLAEGVANERYANKKYDLGGSLKKYSLAEKAKRKIKSNTAALALHKIGTVINNSTDSILLSSVLGLSHMGVYSNYALIISSAGSFLALAVSSASASIGNLGVEANPQKSENVLEVLTFANFFALTHCSAVLLCIINPVIELWIGSHMCFSMKETAVIIACFYMSGIRDPVQLFLRNYGIFKSTRIIPVARGVLNLVLSYVFVKSYGVTGVFAGTLISTLAVPFFSEPYLLYKHGFGLKSRGFIKKYIKYVLDSAVICAVSLFVCSFIKSEGIVGIMLKISISVGVSNGLILLVYRKSKKLKYLVGSLVGELRKKRLIR